MSYQAFISAILASTPPIFMSIVPNICRSKLSWVLKYSPLQHLPSQQSLTYQHWISMYKNWNRISCWEVDHHWKVSLPKNSNTQTAFIVSSRPLKQTVGTVRTSNVGVKEHVTQPWQLAKIIEIQSWANARDWEIYLIEHMLENGCTPTPTLV
jgi:hypothetical protein